MWGNRISGTASKISRDGNVSWLKSGEELNEEDSNSTYKDYLREAEVRVQDSLGLLLSILEGIEKGIWWINPFILARICWQTWEARTNEIMYKMLVEDPTLRAPAHYAACHAAWIRLEACR